MPRGIPNRPTEPESQHDVNASSDEILLASREDILIPEAESLSQEAMAAAGVKEQHARLTFMEEKVLVVVHESANENDEPYPMVSVNGVAQYFIRGEAQWVKRKYVEVLERAKTDSIKSGNQYHVPGLGEEPRQTVQRRRALKYPYTVQQDNNRRGADWLKALKSEDRLNA